MDRRILIIGAAAAAGLLWYASRGKATTSAAAVVGGVASAGGIATPMPTIADLIGAAAGTPSSTGGYMGGTGYIPATLKPMELPAPAISDRGPPAVIAPTPSTSTTDYKPWEHPQDWQAGDGWAAPGVWVSNGKPPAQSAAPAAPAAPNYVGGGGFTVGYN